MATAAADKVELTEDVRSRTRAKIVHEVGKLIQLDNLEQVVCRLELACYNSAASTEMYFRLLAGYYDRIRRKLQEDTVSSAATAAAASAAAATSQRKVLPPQLMGRDAPAHSPGRDSPRGAVAAAAAAAAAASCAGHSPPAPPRLAKVAVYSQEPYGASTTVSPRKRARDAVPVAIAAAGGSGGAELLAFPRSTSAASPHLLGSGSPVPAGFGTLSSPAMGSFGQLGGQLRAGLAQLQPRGGAVSSPGRLLQAASPQQFSPYSDCDMSTGSPGMQQQLLQGRWSKGSGSPGLQPQQQQQCRAGLSSSAPGLQQPPQPQPTAWTGSSLLQQQQQKPLQQQLLEQQHRLHGRPEQGPALAASLPQPAPSAAPAGAGAWLGAQLEQREQQQRRHVQRPELQQHPLPLPEWGTDAPLRGSVRTGSAGGDCAPPRHATAAAAAMVGTPGGIGTQPIHVTAPALATVEITPPLQGQQQHLPDPTLAVQPPALTFQQMLQASIDGNSPSGTMDFPDDILALDDLLFDPDFSPTHF